ncbi:unnamed protein product [Owenia fusiformis]|uniref:Uncharacterized protein n=1 Tax=Owenia fusiformis TaxID=6347 RepID=A0A8J1UUL9_OWEFU|nr:unnamed protein product [Owenia fusiformis]
MVYQEIVFTLALLMTHQQVAQGNFINQMRRKAKLNKIPSNGVFDKFKLNLEGGLSAGGIPKITTKTPNNDQIVNPAASVSVCADIVFANDASCSLGRNVRDDQVKLIIDIASRFQISDIAGARFGAFSFGQYVDVQSKVDFNPGANSDTILTGLESLRTANMTCRTIPYRAMSMASGYFNGDDDRDDGEFKDVLIFIGDGWTSPIRTRKLSLKLADMLKKDDVDILWIKTQARNRRDEKNEIKYGGTAIDVEILPIVGDVDKIFVYTQGDNQRVVNNVSEYLFKKYKCG